MHDLEAAISKAGQAVSTTLEDPLDRAEFLNNRGVTLSDRYKRTGNIHDFGGVNLKSGTGSLNYA